jgi:hypothetical protein
MRLLVLFALILAACNDDGPVAVAPISLERELLDFPMPDLSDESASAMRSVFADGPAPFTVIECENTYIESTEVPEVPEPTMWLNANGKMEVVVEFTHKDWLTSTWSPEFVREDGARAVCVGAKRTEARRGQAWSIFVYPRGLIRNEDWPRPVSRSVYAFSPWEQRELGVLMSTPLTEAKVRRFLELNPEDYGWPAVLEWVEKNPNDDLKYEVLRRYRPTAACSNDRGPGRVRREFLSFCASTGRIKCLLGAYGIVNGSDYPEPIGFAIEDIPTGVDPLIYAVGTILRFPGSPGSHLFLSPPDPGTYKEQYLHLLEEVAKDPNTDPHNRHLIAVALAWAEAGLDEVVAKRRLELAEESWVPASTAAQFRQPLRLVNGAVLRF